MTILVKWQIGEHDSNSNANGFGSAKPNVVSKKLYQII